MPSKEAIEINEMFKSFQTGNNKSDATNNSNDTNRSGNASKSDATNISDQPGYIKEREEGKKRPKPPLPENVTLKEMKLAGQDAELIEKSGNEGPLVMYIHGGGFKTGAAAERREITFEIVDKYGSNVIAINYRLAPENKWPAQLEDCVMAYKEILDLGYDANKVVIAGESAGGTLTLGTILYLKDHGIKLPMAAVAYSAATNNNSHFDSHTANAETDYMLGYAIASTEKQEALFNSLEEAKVQTQSPYISPYFGDFAGICPIFLAVSDIEALYDDSVKIHEKLLEAGVKTELYIGHELIHAYPIFVHLPEARETIKKTFEFINSIRN
ncbi:MAG: alpha/beta hydrolase [Lachnospiraceae bacterium]|nr:alpha/beta hydrolase [Lachnospiraceae bacterium]